MTVMVTTKDSFGDYPMTTTHTYENVWEVQDNGHMELVLKFPDHSCMRIKESDIERVGVEL